MESEGRARGESKWLNWPGALLAGAISGLLVNLTLPFLRWWPLIWVSLVPLFLYWMATSKPRWGGLAGWSFGLALYLGSMYWLGVFGWGAPLAVAALKGLIPALGGWLIVRLKGAGLSLSGNFGLYALLGASLWVLLEYAQTLGVLGLVWAFLPLGLARQPLFLQANTLWGMWGLSWGIALLNLLLAGLLYARLFKAPLSWRLAGGVSALFWLFTLGFGYWRLHLEPPPLEAPAPQKWGVVQLSTPQHLKFQPGYAASHLSALLEASARATRAGAQVILWPETSVPYRHFLESSYLRRQLGRAIRRQPAWYLVGSIEPAPPDGSYNVMSLWDPQGKYRDRYCKYNIVPFGEYLPGRPYWPEWVPGVKLVMNYKPGRGSHTLAVGETPVGVLICFESMCTWLPRWHVLKGAQVLVAPTNDAWFKRTSELPSHFDMAIMRAVELARPVIPAGNTGVSGFVDAYGRVEQESQIEEVCVLSQEVYPRRELTLYARWGDWWVYACALFLVGYSLRAWRQLKSRRSPLKEGD